SGRAWSARLTCNDPASSAENTASVATPSSPAARATRMAISPRFAMSSRFGSTLRLPSRRGPLARASHEPRSGGVRRHQLADDAADQTVDDSLDGRRVTGGGAAALGFRLQEGVRELVVGPGEAARIDRLSLAERRGVALDLVLRLRTGGLDLRGGALEGRPVLRRGRQVADERADRRVDRALDR